MKKNQRQHALIAESDNYQVFSRPWRKGWERVLINFADGWREIVFSHKLGTNVYTVIDSTISGISDEAYTRIYSSELWGYLDWPESFVSLDKETYECKFSKHLLGCETELMTGIFKASCPEKIAEALSSVKLHRIVPF